MSYDFHLFKPRPGEDPLVTAQRDTEELGASAPDPQKEAVKRRVADALIAVNPKLSVFQFRYDEIAKYRNTTVEEARLRYRHLELSVPEDDPSGIQITLYDDEAAVTIPYWHDGDRAADVFRELWRYCAIICREAGYLVYDPQIERVLDPSAGFDEALACYAEVMPRIRKALSAEGRKTKPWWKFW